MRSRLGAAHSARAPWPALAGASLSARRLYPEGQAARRAQSTVLSKPSSCCEHCQQCDTPTVALTTSTSTPSAEQSSPYRTFALECHEAYGACSMCAVSTALPWGRRALRRALPGHTRGGTGRARCTTAGRSSDGSGFDGPAAPPSAAHSWAASARCIGVQPTASLRPPGVTARHFCDGS